MPSVADENLFFLSTQKYRKHAPPALLRRVHDKNLRGTENTGRCTFHDGQAPLHRRSSHQVERPVRGCTKVTLRMLFGRSQPIGVPSVRTVVIGAGPTPAFHHLLETLGWSV